MVRRKADTSCQSKNINMLCVALLPLLSWMPLPGTTIRAAPYALRMKAAPPDAPEERELPSIAIGSICEFHDPKHGAGAVKPVLGIVQSLEFKSKGGARIILADAAGGTHTVAEKALHIILPPAKGKDKEPAEILQDYLKVMEVEDATNLGVDPELLELAWTECAESEKASFSPKSIISMIDASMCKTPVDLYKAFRLVSSDLGKVFFKELGGNKFKAKAMKSVKASKDNWCRAPDHEHEWCFV